MTTAETATSRRVAGTGLHLRLDRSDKQSTTRELAQDEQELSASSTWGSGDWKGDAVTCRSTSAGAVRLRSHTIEMRHVGRREARVQLWRENRTNDVSSEAHGDVADDTAENAKGTDVQEYPVGAEEVDVADVSNKESKGLKRRGEQFLEVCKVLETQEATYWDCPREKAREEVGFGSRTCSCEFRVTRKRVLYLGVSGAGHIQGEEEFERS